MKPGKLDYSSLEKAVGSLSSALHSYLSKNNMFSTEDRELMRDGVIQRFEYTFELSWKTIKRYIELYSLEKADTLTNRDLFRIAAEQGLINDPIRWFDYMLDRNRTSHVYDVVVANDVFKAASEFIIDVEYLLKQFQQRIQ